MNIVFSEVFDASKQDTYHTYGISKKCITPWTFIMYAGNARIIPHNGVGRTCGWATKQEAENAKKNYKKYENCIALVLKNSDSTEGRGPMVFDKIFKNIEKAHEYIMNQVGICGSKQYCNISYGCNTRDGLYGSVDYNGYDLKIVEFADQ